MVTDYLRQKWLRLRIVKMRGMAEINYRIIKLELKLRGARYGA